MVFPLAFVVTKKYFEKSGRARIGSDIRASFKRLKASSAAGVHIKALVFLSVEVIGVAIFA